MNGFQEKACDIKNSMLLPLQECAGLGSPPSLFYAKSSENLNGMLFQKVHYKNQNSPNLMKQYKNF